MNLLKKQGVAWLVTIVMIIAAIGIGYAKAPANNPRPEPGLVQGPGSMPSYVRDEARALSDGTVRLLNERNVRLYGDYGVAIGVLVCNYGRDDLPEYAYEAAEDMGLRGHDMLVVLDIKGQDYGIIRGEDLARYFTDEDCSDYAYDYMEDYFVWGMYDDAVLDLTEALEDWYEDYFD